MIGILKNNTLKILQKPYQNPEWTVDVPSEAELNVMIAEEKAIQEAAMIAMKGQNIKDQVNKLIDEKTSSIKNLASLNTTTLQYAVTWEGMPEHKPLMTEIDKILENNEEIKIKQNQIDQLRNSINEFNENRDKYYADYQKQIQQANIDFKNIEQQIREHNQNSNWGNSNWVNKRQQLYDQRVNMFYDRFAGFEDKTYVDLSKINKLNSEISTIKNSATSQARENLVKAVEDAKKI